MLPYSIDLIHNARPHQNGLGIWLMAKICILEFHLFYLLNYDSGLSKKCTCFCINGIGGNDV